MCNCTLLSSARQVFEAPHTGLAVALCYPTRVPRTFLIDTDTASDDGVALIMALRTPENVAGDERNVAVWSAALRTGRKIQVCWKIDAQRWKESLLSALGQRP